MTIRVSLFAKSKYKSYFKFFTLTDDSLTIFIIAVTPALEINAMDAVTQLAYQRANQSRLELYSYFLSLSLSLPLLLLLFPFFFPLLFFLFRTLYSLFPFFGATKHLCKRVFPSVRRLRLFTYPLIEVFRRTCT